MSLKRTVSLISLLALTILSTSGLASAAALPPSVLYHPAWRGLPATPAYQPSAVSRDLKIMTTLTQRRVVDVVVDSPARIHALSDYAAAVSNPKSPLYHHFLSPRQLDRDFGPTPAMVQVAAASMTHAGWTVTGVKGLVATASIPAASGHPGLPVSPDIWSMTGFAHHGITNPIAAVTTPRAAAVTPDLSLTGENFNTPPVVLQQTTASNGDVVSVMSWNPRVKTSVPAGLPINLFVTVEDPEGNFLPIGNVTNLQDTDNSLVSYGTAAMPGSADTLWQMPLAAWKDVAPGDTLSLEVVLKNGVSASATFPLPAFTGPATVLSALNGQQMNSFSGLPQLPAHPAPVAIFTMGTQPSVSDLQLYLQQNAGTTPVSSITYHYEDGATANQYGGANEMIEADLDMEAVGGAAPGAPLEEYVYPENDTNDQLISFLTDLSQQSTAKIASLSYGFYGEDPSTLTALMNALTAEGITVVEASGDQGAWNGASDPGPVGLSALEQIPSVLSVGGMDLAAPATTGPSGSTIAITGAPIAKAWGGDYLNGIPVTVAQAYTSYNAASAGGYSAETPAPSWQAPFLPSSATGFGVPILAADGGFPGISGFSQGQNVGLEGTSLAAPLTAAWLDDVETILNLSATGMGDINPLLFQAAASNPSLFTQAQWGADGVYSITNGAPGSWNPMTGLGLMNWGTFLASYNTLVPTASPAVSLSATPSVAAGHADALTAYVRGMLNPQYQFSVLFPRTNRWIASAPTSNNRFVLNPPVAGTYEVRVAVTSASGQVLATSKTVNVTSQTPMVSSLKVSLSNNGAVVLPGRSVAVLARATDTGKHPEYAFKIRGPNQRWTSLRGYAGNGTLTLRHLKPGSYAVQIYALDRAQIAAKAWMEAYTRQMIIYVGSRVTLSVHASHGVVTATTRATHITAPRYRFMVDYPNGAQISSGAFAPDPQFHFALKGAGHYHIAAYAQDRLGAPTGVSAIKASATFTAP